MTARGLIAIFATLLLQSAGEARAQATAPARPAAPRPAPARAEGEAGGEVTVRTSLDRTAVWVGDRVTYTIELTCAPGVDILAADLAGEKLALEGLELAAADAGRVTLGDGRVAERFRYQLVTYEVDRPDLRIGELVVRYIVRRPGQRLEDAVPAGEVRIPGANLAWRSTLPEELSTVAVRSDRPAQEVPRLIAYAGPIGVGLVLLSAAPVAFWGAARLRRMRPPRRARHPRASASEIQATLASLREVDASSEAARREAFARLEAALRQHVAEVAGLPALALTPAELAARLRTDGARLPAAEIVELIAECERIRYAPPARVPPPEHLHEAVEAAGRLVSERPR